MGRCLVSEKEERKDVDKEMGRLREIDRESRFWGLSCWVFIFIFFKLRKEDMGFVCLFVTIAEIYLLY